MMDLDLLRNQGSIRAASPLSRRTFMLGAGALCGMASLGLATGIRAESDSAAVLSDPVKAALAQSPLVYISPLLKGGDESRCHGEVWFFVDQGDVVIFASKDSWKARALSLGRNRARIWVGDFGPVGRAGDRFRTAPHFVAQAGVDGRPEVFERLMKSYAKRYAEGWGKWGPRFRKGYHDGTRELIRYRPVAG